MRTYIAVASATLVTLAACGNDDTSPEPTRAATVEACLHARAAEAAADRGEPSHVVIELARDAGDVGRRSDDPGLRADAHALIDAGLAGDTATVAVAVVGVSLACDRLGL